MVPLLDLSALLAAPPSPAAPDYAGLVQVPPLQTHLAQSRTRVTRSPLTARNLSGYGVSHDKETEAAYPASRP